MKKTLFMFMFVLLNGINLFGQTRYWVGLGDVWNSDSWAPASGDVPDGNGPPLLFENAVFDVNSGDCDITVSVLAGQVNSFKVESGYTGIITLAAGVSLDAGSIEISDGLFRGPGSGSFATINTGDFSVLNLGGSPLVQLRRSNVNTTGTINIDDPSFLSAGTVSTWTVGGVTSPINVPLGWNVRNLIINKNEISNNTVTGPVTVSGTLTLTQGRLLIGNNDFIINSGIAISGGSEGSFIVTDGVGFLKQNYTSTIAKSNPVGSSPTNYAMTNLFPSLTGQHGFRMGSYAGTNGLKNSPIISGTGTFDMSILFDISTWTGSFDHLSTALYTGGSMNQMASVSATSPHTLTTTSVISPGLYEVKYQVPFPIELTEFSAKSNGNQVSINWETIIELNSYKFEVYRSEDGEAFTKVGEKLAMGNSQSSKKYDMNENVKNGKYYYKLRNIDIDGSYKISQMVEVVVNSQEDISITQKGNDLIIVKNIESDKTQGIIIDMTGKVLYEFTAHNGENIISPELDNGVYSLIIQDKSKKFVIMK